MLPPPLGPRWRRAGVGAPHPARVPPSQPSPKGGRRKKVASIHSAKPLELPFRRVLVVAGENMAKSPLLIRLKDILGSAATWPTIGWCRPSIRRSTRSRCAIRRCRTSASSPPALAPRSRPAPACARRTAASDLLEHLDAAAGDPARPRGRGHHAGEDRGGPAPAARSDAPAPMPNAPVAPSKRCARCSRTWACRRGCAMPACRSAACRTWPRT